MMEKINFLNKYQNFFLLASNYNTQFLFLPEQRIKIKKELPNYIQLNQCFLVDFKVDKDKKYYPILNHINLEVLKQQFTSYCKSKKLSFYKRMFKDITVGETICLNEFLLLTRLKEEYIILVDVCNDEVHNLFKKLAAVTHIIKDNIFSYLRTDNLDILNEYKHISFKDVRTKVKMSNEHHHHINEEKWSLAFIEKMLEGDDVKMTLIKIMSNLPDCTLAFLQGVVLFLSSIDRNLIKYIIFIFINNTSISDWYEKAKKASVSFKRVYSVHIDSNIIQLFELETLVNRCTNVINLKEDILNRIKGNYTKTCSEDIYKYAYNLFLSGRIQAKERKYKRKSYKDFIDFLSRRYEWATTGNGFYPCKERKYKKKLEILDSIKIEDLYYDAVFCNEMIVHPSIKYEWGKTRAIYSTDTRSYPIFEYLFSDCENVLPDCICIGNSINEKILDIKLNTMSDFPYVLTVDFEDFNSQHSNYTILTIIKAWFDVWKDTMDEDAEYFFKLACSLVLNTVIQYENKSYHIDGSLMTGWRLTTLINSVANYCYHRIIVEKCGFKYRRSFHSGDDMITSLNSIEEYDHYVKMSERLNIRLQLNKTNLSSICEFLRKEYSSGSTTQYLPRSIASLVHGRIESDDLNDLIQALSANDSRYKEYINRGGKPFDVKTMMQYKFCNKYDKAFIDLIIDLPILQGGINNTYMIRDYKNYSIKKRTIKKKQEHSEFSVNDYCKVLARDLKNNKRIHFNDDYYKEIKRYLSMLFNEDAKNNIYIYEIVPDIPIRYEKVFNLVGMFSDRRNVNDYYRSRKMPYKFREIFLNNTLKRLYYQIKNLFPDKYNNVFQLLFK